MTAATPPRKGPHPFILILAGVGLACGIVFVLAQLGGAGAASTYTVTYRALGDGTFDGDLTYTNAEGGTEQQDAGLRWEKTYTMRPGAFVYLSVQNKNDRGAVTCEIQVNGKVVKTSRSEGAYKIASCSGKL